MRVNSRTVLLAAVVVALVAVIVYQLRQGSPTPAAPGAAVAGGRGGPRSGQASSPSGVSAVRLDALEAARNQPAPEAAQRNLFQFKPKAPPPPPPQPAYTPPPQPVVPAGPPPPPPIALKFIGIVQAPNQRLAVLTDAGTRDVFFGQEGDIIDGRYRILRIGVESVEMAYVDGRGRQTIRLTGS